MSLAQNTIPFPCKSGIPPLSRILPITDGLKICSSTHRKKSQTTLENYYRIVFALVRGDIHRPRLPTELVVLICRYAGFSCPCPNEKLSACHEWAGERRRYADSSFWRNAGPARLIPLLKTPPLTKNALRSANKIEIVVNFRQKFEYKSAEYWHMFFINVSRQNEYVGDRNNSETGGILAWPCFKRPSGSFSREYITREPFMPKHRGLIGCNHRIWQQLLPGDCIELSVMGWSAVSPDQDCEAVIRVFEKWEPSFEMLKLA